MSPPVAEAYCDSGPRRRERTRSPSRMMAGLSGAKSRCGAGARITKSGRTLPIRRKPDAPEPHADHQRRPCSASWARVIAKVYEGRSPHLRPLRQADEARRLRHRPAHRQAHPRPPGTLTPPRSRAHVRPGRSSPCPSTTRAAISSLPETPVRKPKGGVRPPSSRNAGGVDRRGGQGPPSPSSWTPDPFQPLADRFHHGPGPRLRPWHTVRNAYRPERV
jgi:hypothetical protein